MSAELEIKFSGDAAFLNALSQGQPLPYRQPSSQPNMGGQREEKGPNALQETAKALGIQPFYESIASTVQQVRTLALAYSKLAGGAANAGSTILNKQATTAAVAQEAAGIAGGAGVAGPLAMSIGAAVVAVGLFSTAVKRSADIVNSETDKLKNFSPQVGAADDLLSIRRELRMMQRGQELGPKLVQWMAQRDRFDAQLTTIWTQILSLLLTGWEKGSPVVEILHDVLASVPAATLYVKHALHTLTDVANKLLAKVGMAIPVVEKPSDVEMATESAKVAMAWATNNLATAGDDLGKEADRLAEEIISNFGTGGRRPFVRPRRED